jgi:hypothetical protein
MHHRKQSNAVSRVDSESARPTRKVIQDNFLSLGLSLLDILHYKSEAFAWLEKKSDMYFGVTTAIHLDYIVAM